MGSGVGDWSIMHVWATWEGVLFWSDKYVGDGDWPSGVWVPIPKFIIMNGKNMIGAKSKQAHGPEIRELASLPCQM